MSTPITPKPTDPDAAAPEQASEHFERPSSFGRLRWWFEESPVAFTASIALALVTLGFYWILTARPLRADLPMTSVALQAVQADSQVQELSNAPEDRLEIEQLAAALGEKVERHEEAPQLPELPPAEVKIKPEELLGNQADTDKEMKEAEAALDRAGELLRKILEANQTRGQPDGTTEGAAGKGVSQIDPNSTPGRQARWVITYPTLPQGEYERMLSNFDIELAYLNSDRKTMQYLANLGGAGRKYNGDADREDRMFWYWVGQNRLKQLDDAILRKHGLEPTSEVVHLYPKELERTLADMEKAYLRRHWQTTDVERVSQTNFKIMPGGPGGWHIEVTSLVLR